MPIRLQDDLEGQIASPRLSDDSKSIFTKLLNAIRIYNVPLINFVIMSVLGFFLLKLTTKYTALYMKNSLITIIVTNLVLFGISETLAQSILGYRPAEPLISFKVDYAHNHMLSFNSNDISAGTIFEPYTDEDDNLSSSAITEDQEVERFIDYVQQDNESVISTGDDGFSMRPYYPDMNTNGNRPTSMEQLTYYSFNRLAGFMVWGFVMAFAQCWWYKFLQIYAKDPKFIEVLRKVLTDQFCYSPISLFCFFTYGTMVLESGTWEGTKEKLSKIYLKTLMINYSVWFPVQFVNFLIVPRNFQVPFSSSISVLWNCFLSMRNSANST
ncbi:hypothetical protein PSN45_000202 [Yamadazyma tenuis]|uniref:Uncharacterized protein n=1 Tax=Candida tenuis (strain ATCC 10573 / BCRC 21748 / CBS 615 / JCM 9827 / NBRC 10315 / NRRL Y-1498 / VKM Y-70) TaxID=590646 RepID=G3BB97_CANTC|nr:uncharacterized protein CANTEDRAFT_124306 [Yamadazyma tenuis ATCC 10573]EGV61525.1 hypothetical protein CANTEDRAFT_124306 [Yamadazyma tenuis ATCC 10573]WEJ92747.1 hypothetical protein PSN45_000202 [Yamadazyma tenuis]